MGEELREQSKPVSGEVGNQTESGTGKGRSSSDSGTSTGKTTGRGRKSTGTGETGTTATDTKGKDESVLELPEIVESPVPVPEKKPAKKRVTKKKKAQKKTTAFSSEQISALLMGVSSILASRQGMEIFMLSETECNQIAVPLANIIVNTGYSESVGKYADHIALGSACLMIFIPRILVFMEQQKAKKIQQNGGLKLERNKETKNSGDGGRSSEPATTPKSNDDKAVLSSIPALA